VRWIKAFEPIPFQKNVFHQHTIRPVTDPKILKTVENYFKEELSDSELGDSTLIADIKKIESNKTTDPTTVQALVNARVGQGKFGSDVRELWNHRCSVAGSTTKVALEASHIQPWADSNDTQRLDPNNGLLLTANLHKLFDAGLISFEASGKMIVSSKLSQSEREIFGLIGKKLSKTPSTETANYLLYHRKFWGFAG
jgi:predicted restriction endonuclease